MSIVAICTPIYDKPSYGFMQSLNQLKKPGRSLPGVTHLFTSHGLSVEVARRVLTCDALSVPEVTHLLWIDDDMVFPADALEQLLAHDVDIVGGLCHNRRPPYHPILARHYAPEWGYGEGVYGFVYDYPPGRLFEVDATGGAFLLVKRRVFDAVSSVAQASWWDPQGHASEDFSFCQRAKAAGFKVLVDTGLEIGHLAEVVVDAAFAKRNRERQWHKWNPALLPTWSTDQKPQASIIIPTYNQDPKLLRAAVFSALAQTVPVEVIVVDDGTSKYIISLPREVRLITSSQNRGISNALNLGIEAMTTPWFCWLSSDDLLDPQKVELQLAAMVQARAQAGFHGYGVINEQGAHFSRYAELPTWRNMREQQEMLAQACCINGSTVIIHRDVFHDVGQFDTNFRFSQDWEMWCRIGQKYQWQKVEEILGTRREGSNLTAAITNDAERRAIRDHEDGLIRSKYAPT